MPPALGAISCWSLMLNPEDRLAKSKTGTIDDSLLLDSSWASSFPWLLPALDAKLPRLVEPFAGGLPGPRAPGGHRIHDEAQRAFHRQGVWRALGTTSAEARALEGEQE